MLAGGPVTLWSGIKRILPIRCKDPGEPISLARSPNSVMAHRAGCDQLRILVGVRYLVSSARLRQLVLEVSGGADENPLRYPASNKSLITYSVVSTSRMSTRMVLCAQRPA